MCKFKDTNLVEKNGDRLVLPDNIIPVNYDLHITPNLNEFTFKGEETIKIKVIKPTYTITIHSNEIEIQSVKINNNNNIENQESKSITFHPLDEIVVFEFENELLIGEYYQLSIKFTGLLNDKSKGFYRSKYNVDGKDRYLASTQFEPCDARRSFPCFDEPALKATFNIKLTVSNQYTALSNMDYYSIENNDNQTKTYRFEETPIMSTYIVAFVVGELEYVERKTKGGIRVRIYKSKGIESDWEFALDVGVRALEFFIDYFGIPYPLTKVDHVAISEFENCAMENWGLITYSDKLLLTSDKTTLLTKQEIVNLIGHELSHMWFGNLLTMEWWSNLWLNEGFAQFMGYLVSDKLYPEWNVFNSFSQHNRNPALCLDSLDSSHAIQVPAYSSSEISEVFDNITYNKGSCLVQMMSNQFCESFLKGIRHYLNKHSFKNTKTDDLWESISYVSDFKVKSIMDAFTKYSGYPIISITPTGEGKFEITQKKFRADGNQEKSDDPIWNCLIKFKHENGVFEYNLQKKKDIITIPNYKNCDWIKPNYGQTGFYRIEYKHEMINSLIPKIKSMELSAVDRIGIISDYSAIVRSESLPISNLMDLLFAFSNETDYDVWLTILDELSEISELVFDQPYKQELEKLICKLLKPISNRLGFDSKQSESSSDTLLRNKINGELGMLGDDEIIKESRNRYEAYKLDSSSLSSDLLSSVLETVIVNGSEIEQQEIIDKFIKCNDISEKSSLLSVISMSPSDNLVLKSLEFSFSKDVKSGETPTLWKVSNERKPIVWNYFKDNFKLLNEKYSENNNYFPSIIKSSLSSKMNQTQLNEVKEFFKDNPVPIANRLINQTLEEIKNNTNWFNLFNQDLLNWINKQ